MALRQMMEISLIAPEVNRRHVMQERATSSKGMSARTQQPAIARILVHDDSKAGEFGGRTIGPLLYL